MTRKRYTQARALSRFLVLVLPVLVLLGVSACSGDASNDPIVIRFSHVTSPGTPKGQAAEQFRKIVSERMSGRVEVKIYPSGQLMSDDDSLDSLAFGEIQMIAVSLSKFDRLTSKFQIFDLPFLFPDLAAVERFQQSLAGRQLFQSMDDRGLLGVAYWHNGMKQFSGPVAMRTPEAARDLKFRIMESDVLQEQILHIGGSPQKMAFGEVYQALQTGAVDAQENTWSNMYSAKLYEVQPFLTATNHGYFGYLVTVNAEFWTALPIGIRDELEVILAEVTQWGNQRSAQINREDKEKIRSSGSSEIVSLSDAELAVWRSAMLPVWSKFEEKIGAELIHVANGKETEAEGEGD